MDEWSKSVDERLVNLTSAQKSADVDLHRFKKDMERLDRILRGDPVRDVEGLTETVNYLAREARKFNAMFDKDYLGHGGLASFITYVYNDIKDQKKNRESVSSYKWAFWTATLAAFIGLAGLILTNRDQFIKWLPQNHPTPLDVKIEAVRHPKSHHRHITIKETDSEPIPVSETAPEDSIAQ